MTPIIGNLIAILLVAGLVAISIREIRKSHSGGGCCSSGGGCGSCGGGCAGCSGCSGGAGGSSRVKR